MDNTEKSGGTRFSSGKPSGWWYAPLHGLRLVAEVWEKGGEKYAPADWKSGQSFSTLIDCAMRHMLCVLHEGPWARDEDVLDEDGNVVSKGTGAYHAANAVWNLLTLLTFMALKRYDLDDVSGWGGVTTAVKNENGFSLQNPPPSQMIPMEFEAEEFTNEEILQGLDPLEAEEQVAPAHRSDMTFNADGEYFTPKTECVSPGCACTPRTRPSCRLRCSNGRGPSPYDAAFAAKVKKGRGA